ncbi:MAG: four helix bundle protein [Lachnospiraceae bacterium]|nr:four helix bundle protein [Lachnospiraceae bacterium]
MNTKGSELSVITQAKALSEYVLTITEKSPKKYRFTLVTRLQNYSLDVIEALIAANEIYVSAPDTDEAGERLKLQRKSMTSLKLLGYISEVAMKHDCILSKHYEQITKQIYDVQNLLGAWMNSDKKRFARDRTVQ